MNLNEQLIKHQLRSKFMLEAMTVLSKIVKEKGSATTNPIKQKCLILASLSVIEALVNTSSPSAKVPSISGENFLNSLRVCFVRDASHKDLNLPSSFLRIVDDLLTDFIDVSLPSNAEFVSKCVNILKIMADFVHIERKKEEAKLNAAAKKEEKKTQVEAQLALI